jgi:hypothetical protein
LEYLTKFKIGDRTVTVTGRDYFGFKNGFKEEIAPEEEEFVKLMEIMRKDPDVEPYSFDTDELDEFIELLRIFLPMDRLEPRKAFVDKAIDVLMSSQTVDFNHSFWLCYGDTMRLLRVDGGWQLHVYGSRLNADFREFFYVKDEAYDGLNTYISKKMETLRALEAVLAIRPAAASALKRIKEFIAGHGDPTQTIDRFNPARVRATTENYEPSDDEDEYV